MSSQHAGEYSREGRGPRASPDGRVKQAKEQVNQLIKGGAAKAVLHHKAGEMDGTRSSSYGSTASSWDSLPSLWRSALLLEVLFFGLPGLLSLFYPSMALDYVRQVGRASYTRTPPCRHKGVGASSSALLHLCRSINHAFNWAGPSPGVASNTLLMYVQWVGALGTSLAALAAWGSYIRSVDFAKGWALFRLVLSVCLLYIAFLQPGTSVLSMLGRPLYSIFGLGKEVYTAGSSTYKFLLLPFAHSVLMTSLLAMSPDFLQSIFQKAPTFLS